MEHWKKIGRKVAFTFVVMSGLIMIMPAIFLIMTLADFQSEREGNIVAIGMAVFGGLFILDALFVVGSGLSFGLFKMEEKNYQGNFFLQAKKISPYMACGLLAAPLLLLVSIPMSRFALFLIMLWLLCFSFSLFLFLVLCIGALMERKRAKSSSAEPTP